MPELTSVNVVTELRTIYECPACHLLYGKSGDCVVCALPYHERPFWQPTRTLEQFGGVPALGDSHDGGHPHA